ncbi:hypothetical protein GCM10007966_16860 [Legionella impletisoli]|uniref:Transmembrane protein n=2 Tax=Legionella impletisoli TaxID=343510 RepID=A0A917NCE6_9GAMM|nr:hypothetical protein GCM10007966_16860 [Legionella impletisoli]
MLAITTVVVIGMAVAYYFWEVFLFAHYLGGYDEYGLPIQRSHPGFYFFIQAWPLWVFPIFIVILLVLFLTSIFQREKEQKINHLKAEMIEHEKALEALELELELVRKEVKKTRIERNLKKELEELEEEFAVLMEDYQQSQQFIEKLLQKIKQQES